MSQQFTIKEVLSDEKAEYTFPDGHVFTIVFDEKPEGEALMAFRRQATEAFRRRIPISITPDKP